jgi:N-acetylglucosamine-6-sulfatase
VLRSQLGKRLALLLLLVLVACSPEAEQRRSVAHEVGASPDRLNTALFPVERLGPSFQMRHAAINRLSGRESVELVFLGDSITRRWEEAGSEVWRAYYGARRVANFGIDGDRTQNVLWRLENGNLDDMHPRGIVLLIGTNNTGAPFSPENTADEIAEGVLRIVAELRRRSPESQILLMGVFPKAQRADNPLRKQVADINARLAAADDGRWVHYRDIGDEFLTPDGSISLALMPDALHLSPRGYAVWARAIESDIAGLLEETEVAPNE